jgi:hypothetical protein
MCTRNLAMGGVGFFARPSGPPAAGRWAGGARRFPELAVFDARFYIRVRRIDEPA